MTTTTTPVMAKSIYARILGGPQSDEVLHTKLEGLIRPAVTRKSRLLDMGVGRAHLTAKLAKLGPAELVVSDYQAPTVQKAIGYLRSLNGQVPPHVKLTPLVLDVSSDFSALDGHSFDLGVCASVHMHLAPEVAAESIRRIGERTARTPGARSFIAVLCTEVARSVYVPSSRGECAYYPRLKGLPNDATEADYAGEAEVLLEHYPDEQLYYDACQETGLKVTVHHALGNERCAGTIYRDFVGRPLWTIYELCN